MSPFELIGFVISLSALLFLFIKQVYDENKRRKNPEAAKRYEEEQKRMLKVLYGEISPRDRRHPEDEEDAELEEVKSVKLPPNRPLFIPPKPLEITKSESSLPTYEEPINRLFEKHSPRKMLMISSTILSLPKSYEPFSKTLFDPP